MPKTSSCNCKQIHSNEHCNDHKIDSAVAIALRTKRTFVEYFQLAQVMQLYFAMTFIAARYAANICNE